MKYKERSRIPLQFDRSNTAVAANELALGATCPSLAWCLYSFLEELDILRPYISFDISGNPPLLHAWLDLYFSVSYE